MAQHKSRSVKKSDPVNVREKSTFLQTDEIKDLMLIDMIETSELLAN